MSGPVVTFLSKSPSASRKTLALLGQLSNHGMERVVNRKDVTLDNSSNSDILNDSSFPSVLKWDSAASKCRETGTILHLLSIYNDGDKSNFTKDEETEQNLSLLAITPSSPSTDSIQIARDALGLHIQQQQNLSSSPLHHYYNGAKLYTRWKLGLQITSDYILGPQSDGLPLLHFLKQERNAEINSVQNRIDSSSHSIREIVLPHRNDAKYTHNGSSLLQELASNMHRPLTGLYQWNKSSNDHNSDQHHVYVRPLPTADQDMILSSPTIVFRCNNHHGLQERMQQMDTLIQLDKIGFNGGSKDGQILVRHDSLTGLDVRFCNAHNLSSTFAEAQESLLAGSLQELQSAHVLTEGMNNHDDYEKQNNQEDRPKERSDEMNGFGDCWVEFRANIKRPTGFWRNLKQSSFTKKIKQSNHTGQSKLTSKNRIVKAPNLPFE